MDNLPRGAEVQPLPTFKFIPAHGPTTEYTTGGVTYESGVVTASAGLSYIGSHFVYVVVFILMTLGMYYLVGRKATVYFLLLVLLGQLIIPGGTGAGITELTKSFKIFQKG